MTLKCMLENYKGCLEENRELLKKTEKKDKPPFLCSFRIYGTDTCGVTKNTCYRDAETIPDFCPLKH